MKRISINERSKEKLLHIEAPGCIINIQIDLADRNGQKVTHVSIIADGSRYAGDPPWWIEGETGAQHRALRVVQTDTAPHPQSAAMMRAIARERPLSLRDGVAGVNKACTDADFGAAYREDGES